MKVALGSGRRPGLNQRRRWADEKLPRLREWPVQRLCGAWEHVCAGPQRFPEKIRLGRQAVGRLFIA